jgi:hypothetical protein
MIFPTIAVLADGVTLKKAHETAERIRDEFQRQLQQHSRRNRCILPTGSSSCNDIKDSSIDSKNLAVHIAVSRQEEL